MRVGYEFLNFKHIYFKVVLIALILKFPVIANAATIGCAGAETITSNSAVRYDQSAGTCTISDNTAPLTGSDDITFVVLPDPIAGSDPPNDATEEVYFGTGSGTNQTSHTGCQLGATTVNTGLSCSKPSFHIDSTFVNTVNRLDSNGNSVVMTVNTTTSSAADIAMRFSIDNASVVINNAPRITSIGRQSPASSSTDSDTVTWRVTFDENVQNVDASDFTLTGTTASLSVNSVSATVYDITASGGDIANLNATTTLGIAGGQNISDTASVALFNTTPTGTNNNTFVIQNDIDRPSVQILNAPSSLNSLESFNVTIEFSEAVTGFTVGDITVANGATSNFVAEDGNTYTADISPNGAGAITIDVAAGIAQDGSSNANMAAAQVTVACGAGCGETATVTRTKNTIQNYTGNRIRRITAQGPGISSFLGGDVMGGSFDGFFDSPVAVNFNGDSDNNSGSFSTSFQQLLSSSLSLHADENSSAKMTHVPSPANIWIKGRWSKVNDERAGLDDEINFGIIYLGADYKISDDLLVGFMGQYDWFDEKETVLGSQAEGKGWMVGPYLVTRLRDSLIADVRLAWGKSDNKISPLNTYWDKYDGERWQFEGNLTGSFKTSQWLVAPTIGLNYFQETQERYIDSNGFTISEQSIELGTLSFGPRVTYLADGYDGSHVYPYVSAKGVWDFKAPDIYGVNGIASGTEELRGQVGVGVNIFTTEGTSVSLGYTYDGIGISDYESHTGEASATISLDGSGMPKGSNLTASYSLQTIMLQSTDEQTAKFNLSIPFD